jgi:hypothetical protein
LQEHVDKVLGVSKSKFRETGDHFLGISAEIRKISRRQQMEVSRILAEIDAQISKLQQARALLSGDGTKTKRGPGRPKGSSKAAGAAKKSTKRRLSPEGRKRIADAMKKRWAERRKQGAKSLAGK